MARVFDPEQAWPDLFEGLTEQERWAISQALAMGWHEGWKPNRADVEFHIKHRTADLTPEQVLDLLLSTSHRS